MSILTAKYVVCDGTTAEGQACSNRILGAEGGGRGPTHAEARRGATGWHWERVGDGPAKDYCPQCREAQLQAYARLAGNYTFDYTPTILKGWE